MCGSGGGPSLTRASPRRDHDHCGFLSICSAVGERRTQRELSARPSGSFPINAFFVADTVVLKGLSLSATFVSALAFARWKNGLSPLKALGLGWSALRTNSDFFVVVGLATWAAQGVLSARSVNGARRPRARARSSLRGHQKSFGDLTLYRRGSSELLPALSPSEVLDSASRVQRTS